MSVAAFQNRDPFPYSDKYPELQEKLDEIFLLATLLDYSINMQLYSNGSNTRIMYDGWVMYMGYRELDFCIQFKQDSLYQIERCTVWAYDNEAKHGNAYKIMYDRLWDENLADLYIALEKIREML